MDGVEAEEEAIVNGEQLRLIVPDQLVIWVAVFIGVAMGAGVVGCWWACASGWHQENREPMMLGVPRSPKWPALRKVHIEAFPQCEVCGQVEPKDQREVHHVKAYHLHPELELEPSNLRTVHRNCFGGFPGHCFAGHLMDWSDINPNFDFDASYLRTLFKRRKGLTEADTQRFSFTPEGAKEVDWLYSPERRAVMLAAEKPQDWHRWRWADRVVKLFGG